MICNHCGTTVQDNIKFCPKCGNSLVASISPPNMPSTPGMPNAPIAQNPYQGQAVYQGGQVSPKNTEGQKDKNRIILIICIVIAAAVCAVYFLYSQGVFQNFVNRSDTETGRDNDRVITDEEDEKDEPKKDVDHSEAYDAYLEVLIQEKSDIDTYNGLDYQYDWEVSFLDVDAMSHPLMVIEALDDGEYDARYNQYYFNGYLRIYSYDEGLYEELDRFVLNSVAGSNTCSVFTTSDGYLYYLQWEGDEGGCHLIIEEYSIDSSGLVAENDWALDFDMLPTYDEDHSNDADIIDTEFWRNASYGDPDLMPPVYSRNGKSVSQSEFFNDVDKILGEIETMSVNDIPEIIIRAVEGDSEKSFSLTSYKSNAMTYNDAIEMLGGEVPAASTVNVMPSPVFPNVSASSVREAMGNNSYGPEKARDGDWATAWCEGQSGNGVGAWIELSANTKQTVIGVQILNGYCKSEKTYFDNNTVSEVMIVTDEGEYVWILQDLVNTYQEYYFNDPIETRSIRIYLTLVNEKGDGQDTLISELSAF